MLCIDDVAMPQHKTQFKIVYNDEYGREISDFDAMMNTDLYLRVVYDHQHSIDEHLTSSRHTSTGYSFTYTTKQTRHATK